MKRVWFTLLTILFCIPPIVYAQETEYDVYSSWHYRKEVSNNLYDQLSGIAFAQLHQRKQATNKLRSRADWSRRRTEVRETLTKIIGAFPPRTPLKPKITGIITKEGYRVEKFIFESRPEFFVTAALFLPQPLQGKAPAIVYCCGHSANGFRSETYQHIILNLVKKGFVVLAFDPIGQGERIQYFNEDGTPRFKPTHEHAYPGAQSFIAGLSPANYFIWDGIRCRQTIRSIEKHAGTYRNPGSPWR